MAVRDIVTIGDPRLRVISAPIGEDAFGGEWLSQLVADLIETMRSANGAGIAAPQIGELYQVCVLEVKDNPRYPYKPNIPLTVLVNPVITPLSNETFSNFEGCLSVPGMRGRVSRFTHIRVEARTPAGDNLSIEAKGLTAGTYQHEIDHLNGVLYFDYSPNGQDDLRLIDGMPVIP